MIIVLMDDYERRDLGCTLLCYRCLPFLPPPYCPTRFPGVTRQPLCDSRCPNGVTVLRWCTGNRPETLCRRERAHSLGGVG